MREYQSCVDLESKQYKIQPTHTENVIFYKPGETEIVAKSNYKTWSSAKSEKQSRNSSKLRTKLRAKINIFLGVVLPKNMPGKRAANQPWDCKVWSTVWSHTMNQILDQICTYINLISRNQNNGEPVEWT